MQDKANVSSSFTFSALLPIYVDIFLRSSWNVSIASVDNVLNPFKDIAYSLCILVFF